MERYKFGQEPIPWWIERKITPYRKWDGSIGYVLERGWDETEIKVGDTLTVDGERIKVKHGEAWREIERLFEVDPADRHKDRASRGGARDAGE